MNSLTDLAEVVDVVIGVDTHVHTHSAAVVNATTGGVLDEITVEPTAEGYEQLVELADEHATLRAWAIEGHRWPWRRPGPAPGRASGDRGRARPTQAGQASQRCEVRSA